MDVNYHTNRIIAHRSSGGYFMGSPSRQYGSGIGSAIRLGLKGFVLPIAKKYGVLLARNFIGAAAPELLKVLEGSSKPKEEFRSAPKTTIRKQLGGGRSGTFRRLYTSNTPSRRRVSLPQRTRKRTMRKISRPSFRKRSNRLKRTSRVKRRVGRKSGKKTVSRKRKSTTTNRGSSQKTASKKRSRNDFFTSIVDAATR